MIFFTPKNGYGSVRIITRSYKSQDKMVVDEELDNAAIGSTKSNSTHRLPRPSEYCGREKAKYK